MKYALFTRSAEGWIYSGPLCETHDEALAKAATLNALLRREVSIQEVHE